MALTDLVEAADIGPTGAHQPLMRRVILWCVEAYFGRVGGDVVGRDGDSLGDLHARVEPVSKQERSADLGATMSKIRAL